MARKLRKYDCQLELRSPVFIGGRVRSINKLEFLQGEGSVYLPDISRLIDILHERTGQDIVEDFTSYITNAAAGNRQIRGSLTDFVTDKRFDIDALCKALGASRIELLTTPGKINEFMPFTRDGFGVPYIPGSSIKGAIRTALMASRYEKKKLKDKFPAVIKSPKFAARDAEAAAFRLPERGDKVPNYDLMRSLRVSDAYGSGTPQTAIAPVMVLTYQKDRQGNAIAEPGATMIYQEVMLPGQSLKFTMTIEEGLATALGHDSELTADIINDELKAFYGQTVFQSEARAFILASGSSVQSGKGEFAQWVRQKYPGRSFSLKQQEQLKKKWLAETGKSQSNSSLSISDSDTIKLQKVRDFYGGSACNLRIGAGVGLKSVSMLDKLDTSQRMKVFEKLPKPPGLKGKPPKTWSEPKSRKLAMENGQPWLPMGWCELSIESS